MIPETAGVLLHAYIDGELDAASTIELESQIAASPALRQEMERLAALSHAVKTHATRFNAPSRLSKTLFAAFPDSQAETSIVRSSRMVANLGARHDRCRRGTFTLESRCCFFQSRRSRASLSRRSSAPMFVL